MSNNLLEKKLHFGLKMIVTTTNTDKQPIKKKMNNGDVIRLSREQTSACDLAPFGYINTRASERDGCRKLGAPALLNCFLWPTMHFISFASITHTPTEQHVKTLIAKGAPQAVLHNDMSAVSEQPQL